MDSQMFGTLAAAVITAVAGLAGVAMARRASYGREQLQHMREEAELLALLPEGDPMRDCLSKLLAIRIRGYGRMFEVEALHPRRLWPPAVLALAGPVIFSVVILTGGWSTVWDVFGDALSGRTVTATEWQIGTGWFAFVIVAAAMYIIGFLNLVRRGRERAWARAMRDHQH